MIANEGIGKLGEAEIRFVCYYFPNTSIGACIWNEWGPWGSCTKSCDGGTKERSRTIKTKARDGGQECEESAHNTTTCNTNECSTNTELDQTDFMYMMIGVAIGVVVLLFIGIGTTIFLVKKFKCCNKTNSENNEQEMAPLRSTGRRPLPLAQFRQRNDPCRPTEDEFEKMESDARNRNISKSNSTAMEFVNSKIPINRY